MTYLIKKVLICICFLCCAIFYKISSLAVRQRNKTAGKQLTLKCNSIRVLVCDCACVRHTRACGNLGAKEVRSFMDLCVRMCVRAGFFGCVTRVRSHLKFFNKIMKNRLKRKVFLRQRGIFTFTWIKSSQEFYRITEITLLASHE